MKKMNNNEFLETVQSSIPVGSGALSGLMLGLELLKKKWMFFLISSPIIDSTPFLDPAKQSEPLLNLN